MTYDRGAEVAAAAAAIVERVRKGGSAVLRQLAEQHDGLPAGAPLWLGRRDLEAALAATPAAERQLLERTAARIEAFARAQRAALLPARIAVPGGYAAHEWAPVECAGCYAPGGRFPLPSTVLMTAVTAAVAGVQQVVVSSPRAPRSTLAAAAIAGAEGVLLAGGAQAIAALALGIAPAPKCDVVVGPGNAWVTAAKRCLYGEVGIDLLAGPSELVVIADDSADAATVAADLAAQGEHDPEAAPTLITTCAALEVTLDHSRFRTIRVATLAEACAAANEIAPEHLQLSVRDPEALVPQLRHYGALFTGRSACEVLGDYGAGPNHVLPTAGGARFTGGLSVLHFLRLRTRLHLDDARELARDAAALARLEGLEAHARAAERRLGPVA